MHSDAVEAALDPFFSDGLIEEVLYQLKSGKEATVYCCRAKDGLVAAKVYKPRGFRGFRNDAVYQEGRVILDRRAARAVARRSDFGQAVKESLWTNHEWETLRVLHAAGADVPRPIAHSNGAIVMEFVGDEDGPAPALKEARLDEEERAEVFEQLMDNIQLWLAYDVVHGDLSPFNVLYHQGAPVVIDFPQAVDPRFNGNAFDLLVRDVSNIARYARRDDGFALAERYWSVWERP